MRAVNAWSHPWQTKLRGVLALAASIAPGLGTPAPAHAASAIQMRTIHPRRGIGVIHLGESHRGVDRTLGWGRRITHGPDVGLYVYRSGELTLEVSYEDTRVASMSTNSRSAVLYGHLLDEGLSVLEPILSARGWTVLTCDGEVFTALLPGGPGTGIAWKNGRLHEVVIDEGGSWGQQCEPP